MGICGWETSILGHPWLYRSKQIPTDSLVQKNFRSFYLYPNWPISINWNGYSHCSARARHAHHILIAFAPHAHCICTTRTLNMHGVHLTRQTNVHCMPTAHALHVLYMHTAHVMHAHSKCKAGILHVYFMRTTPTSYTPHMLTCTLHSHLMHHLWKCYQK